MKAINAIPALRDKPLPDNHPNARWSKVPVNGGEAKVRLPDPKHNEEFFRALGKSLLFGALPLGVGSALIASAGRPTAPLSSRSGLTVPLTEEEQQAMLTVQGKKERRKRRKFGSTDMEDEMSIPAGSNIRSDGTVTVPQSDNWYNRLPGLGPWVRKIQGLPFYADPAQKAVGNLSDKALGEVQQAAKPQQMAPQEASGAEALMNNAWLLPIAGASILGAGALGFGGVQAMLNARRKKKLQAARDRAKQEFMEALLAERTSKVGSAIDGFLSACEEKVMLKEAGTTDLLLGLLGLIGVGAGGMGFYNGLKSEPGDLRRLRAMRKARERQLAMQDEFEPQVRPDFSFLPSEAEPDVPLLESSLGKESGWLGDLVGSDVKKK